MEIFLYILAVIFALLGLSETIHRVACYFLSADDFPPFFMIVPLQGENAELELRTALENIRQKRFGRRAFLGVVAVDVGLSAETNAVCQTLCAESGCISFCPKERLWEILCDAL